MFYTFNSLSVPPTIYRYDIATRASSVFRAPSVPGYDAAQFETKQVFYPSKDGTRIPMFLVYRKGLQLDGNNPTLLYGYGGFNIVVSPTFSAARIALLEQGFVYASANLRGGAEYGEAWHRQGMKLDKQNVFDDFIAAAEWLIEQKYTSSARLAITGRSNGGLLVGAVMNQRPELFGAAVPEVGVMDMLRFHKFTIGWNWIADYGSSDDAEEFKALYAYSPLHNIRPGVKYPPTLITTADHDDRVVPAHSFKYAATLQALASRENPGADPHRDEVRPRREQPHEAARGGGRHLRVHDAQPRCRAMSKDPILGVAPLAFPWQTKDPFLVCVHHVDLYPQGNDRLGPAASLDGPQHRPGLRGQGRLAHVPRRRRCPGFPQHPHRGFETVTFVREGYIDHSDSLGATARFGRGDVQWLTAGAGIVHSEMFPLLKPDAGNRLELFQIWLNLPAKTQVRRAVLHDVLGQGRAARIGRPPASKSRSSPARSTARSRRRRRRTRGPRIPTPTSRSGHRARARRDVDAAAGEGRAHGAHAVLLRRARSSRSRAAR